LALTDDVTECRPLAARRHTEVYRGREYTWIAAQDQLNGAARHLVNRAVETFLKSAKTGKSETVRYSEPVEEAIRFATRSAAKALYKDPMSSPRSGLVSKLSPKAKPWKNAGHSAF